MSPATIAWYGKLPSHGDFLQRRAPLQFVSTWDDWLQRCLAHLRQQFGCSWQQAYLASPLWRFFLCDGVIGAASFAGVVVPSVDKVGRCFPLTIFTQLPSELPPMAIAIHGRDWLRSIEAIALGALENVDLKLEDFDAALHASAGLLTQVELYYRPSLDGQFPVSADYWRLPMSSSDRAAGALIDPLMLIARRSLQPMSMWWTDGSEQVAASCLLVRALPEPSRVTAMMDGRWAAAGWSGDLGELPGQAALPPAMPDYQVLSAGRSDSTADREVSHDSWAEYAAAGLWLLADGTGRHSSGLCTSRWLVDALTAVVPQCLQAPQQGLQSALLRINTDLLGRGADKTPSECTSTVVVLTVRHLQWDVYWCGHSRAYLLRNAELLLLTQNDMCPLGSGALLQLGYSSGELMVGDRFLLCSDGLHRSLAWEQLRAVLAEPGDPRVVVERLITQARAAGATDDVTALIVDIVAGGTCTTVPMPTEVTAGDPPA